jgi:hypothetical protein
MWCGADPRIIEEPDRTRLGTFSTGHLVGDPVDGEPQGSGGGIFGVVFDDHRFGKDGIAPKRAVIEQAAARVRSGGVDAVVQPHSTGADGEFTEMDADSRRPRRAHHHVPDPPAVRGGRRCGEGCSARRAASVRRGSEAPSSTHAARRGARGRSAAGDATAHA